MQHFFESQFNFFLCQWLVAMWCEQAKRGREDGPFAITLNASAFQYKIGMIFDYARKSLLLGHFLGNGIVLLPCKLLAPAIEFEIQIFKFFSAFQR